MATVAEKVKFQPEDAREQEDENQQNDPDLSGITSFGDAQIAAEKDASFEEVLGRLDQLFGPGEIFDPEKLQFEDMPAEKREEALGQLENMIGQAARSKRQGRQPAEKYGGGEIPTFRIGPSGPIKLEAKSDSRYCLGLHLENNAAIELGLRRFVIAEPQRQGGIPGGYPELDVPAPTNKKARLAIQTGAIQLGEWQREQVRARAKHFLKEQGLIPVKADPVTGVDETPCRSFTIKAMDKDVVKAIAGGIGEMHYLSSLFSGGGFAGYDKNETPLPKQSEEHFHALPPEEITRITELLVGARFDGIVDGGSPYIPAKSSEGTWKTLEGQFRAASFPGDSLQQLRSSSTREAALSALEETQISKGTLRPYRRSFVWRRIQRFWADVEEASPAQSDALYERYADAVAILTKALYRKEDTLILALGDQVKIGSEPAEGKALVTRTFLEGETQDTPEPTGEVEGDPVEGTPVFEPDYSMSPRRKQMVAYHAHSGTQKRKKPVQFRIIKNPQVFQFMKPSAEKPFWEHLKARTEEVYEKLCTTKGIAELVSDREARTREEIENGEGAVVGQDKTLLNLGIQTGAIQMESSAREKALRGELPDPSDVHMPRQLLGRLGAVLGAHVKRRLLRGLGGEAKSYLHATVENSQKLVRRLWGIGAANYLGGEKVIYNRKYPFYDQSCCALPEKITRKINADDDGDLTQGIAAPYVLGESSKGDGHVVKMTEIFRYPCVDAPIYCAFPAGTKTPFDAESKEERKAYQDMLAIADPYIPEGQPDVRSDGITIAEPRNMWRLSDKGAKEDIDKERIGGEITYESAFSFCERGASLNQAGPLTRDLERFGELARRAKLEAQADPSQEKYFEQAKDEFLTRGAATRLAAENVLSAFKYATDGGFQSPPMVPRSQTMNDPLGMGDSENVTRDVLPMNYHAEISSIERTTERFASNGETSLEGLSGESSLTRGCRISRILGHLVNTQMPKLWEAIGEIDTDPTYFTHGSGNGGLKKRLTEWYEGATEKEAQQVKSESLKCRQAFDVWRRAWQLVIEEQQQLMNEASALEKPDLMEELAEERQAISQTLRRYMRAVAKGKHPKALQHAIYADWGEEENTAAAGMALISDRLGEVFPRAEVTYEPSEDPEDTAVVYCHEDFPGLMFEETPVRKLAMKDDGSALAETPEKALLLHPANGKETISNLLPAKKATLRRVSRRRAVLSVS
jgi:hypothetical protein